MEAEVHVESICRCCLGQNACHNLFIERKLAQRFVICTSLMLDILDDFPKLICHNCYETLLKCYDFQIMCAESNDSFLNKQFKTNSLRKHTNNNEDVVKEDFVEEQSEMMLGEKLLEGMEEVYIVSNDSIATEVQIEEVTSVTDESNTKCMQQHLFSDGAPLQNYETNANIKLHYCTFEDCSRVYSAKRSLRHHIKELHFGNAANKGEYICEICGKIFERKFYLRRHRYVHMNKSEYPFGCEYCGQRFYAKQFLRDHLYRHAGIKMFFCNHCGISKSTKVALQGHINCCHNASYRKQQWKCSKCDKHFSSSSNLKVHITSVHECRRAFACRFCELRFAKLDTLRNHEMRHTGLKPNKCNICERAFIQRGALYKHQLRVHNVQ